MPTLIASDPVVQYQKLKEMIADHFDTFPIHMDKPCGKSHISPRKKCSKEKLAVLTSDLKAGDAGAKKRVAEGKKKAAEKQALKREVQRDKGKKSELLDKVSPMRDTKKKSSGEKKVKELPIESANELFGSIYDVIPDRKGSVQLTGITDEGDHYKVNYVQGKATYSEKVSKEAAQNSLEKQKERVATIKEMAGLPKPATSSNGKLYLELTPGKHNVGDEIVINHNNQKVKAKVASVGKVFKANTYATATNLKPGSDLYDQGDFLKAGKQEAQRFYLSLPLIKKKNV